MKKLLKVTSTLALLMYFIPFISYQTSKMPSPVGMNFIEVWLGKVFTVSKVEFNAGHNVNMTFALVFALLAIACAWLFRNKWLLRATVFVTSAASLYFFLMIRSIYSPELPFAAALNEAVGKGGVEFRVNLFYSIPIVIMALNALFCLTTDRFAANMVRYKWWYLMILPSVVFLLVFVYIPMAGLALMFVDLNINDMFKSTFVGLKWFRLLWSNIGGEFGVVLANTVIIAVLKLIVTFPAPIVLAIFINDCRLKVYKRVVQTVSYLPNFISWSIIGGLIITLFNSQYSTINGIRQMVDSNAKGFYLLNEANLIRTTLVVSTLWKSIGWESIIYIAALTTVNPELYESARLDGAGKLRQIWNITLPGISALIVLKFIFAMPSLIADNMDQALVLVYPLTVSRGKTLSMYIYEIGIKNRGNFGMSGNYSFSATIGFCNQLISFCLLLFGNALGRRVNPEGAVW